MGTSGGHTVTIYNISKLILCTCENIQYKQKFKRKFV